MRSYVYFARELNGKRIKIGCSSNPQQRVRAQGLILIAVTKGDSRRETEIHKLFRHLPMEREWFRDTAELRTFISNLRSSPKLPGAGRAITIALTSSQFREIRKQARAAKMPHSTYVHAVLVKELAKRRPAPQDSPNA